MEGDREDRIAFTSLSRKDGIVDDLLEDDKWLAVHATSVQDSLEGEDRPFIEIDDLMNETRSGTVVNHTSKIL